MPYNGHAIIKKIYESTDNSTKLSSYPSCLRFHWLGIIVFVVKITHGTTYSSLKINTCRQLENISMS